MKRGSLVVVADRAGGDYGGKPRPAVIVQSDQFDTTGSVAVCLITSVPDAAPLLRIGIAPSAGNGLVRHSWIAVEKLLNIRRARVGRRIGALTADELSRLDDSLGIFLALR